MMQHVTKSYNEKHLAQVQQITHASREEIISAIQLAQVKLEEIIECLGKNKNTNRPINQNGFQQKI